MTIFLQFWTYNNNKKQKQNADSKEFDLGEKKHRTFASARCSEDKSGKEGMTSEEEERETPTQPGRGDWEAGGEKESWESKTWGGNQQRRERKKKWRKTKMKG